MYQGISLCELELVAGDCDVSDAEDGSIMAGPEGARPPSLDGGSPGDHGGPLIPQVSFKVK